MKEKPGAFRGLYEVINTRMHLILFKLDYFLDECLISAMSVI